MFELTVLLAILALAMLIGMILIELIPSGHSSKVSYSSSSIEEDSSQEINQNLIESAEIVDNSVLETRIDRLERLINRSNSFALGSLQEKLHKIDNLSANTKVEVKALREQIEKLSDKKTKKSKKKTERELTTEEMRALIFGSKNKKN